MTAILSDLVLTVGSLDIAITATDVFDGSDTSDCGDGGRGILRTAFVDSVVRFAH